MNSMTFVLLWTGMAALSPYCLQAQGNRSLWWRMDSLLASSQPRPFNGVALVAKGKRVLFCKALGFQDIRLHTPLHRNSTFVIGSVSKQVTAYLTILAHHQGLLDLHEPIRKCLPMLPQAWADTITPHQLLCHTSGLVAINQPLAHRPGTAFTYSNAGYALLGTILEHKLQKPYFHLVADVFTAAGMQHSGAPGSPHASGHVIGHHPADGQGLAVETQVPDSTMAAAGGIVASAPDLVRWNYALYHHKLLDPASLAPMFEPSSIRPHPIFGNVEYGYGLQFYEGEGMREFSHGGMVPGFVAVNFYYPDSDISLIVLENLDWQDPKFQLSFYFEMQLRSLLRASNLLMPSK